jgi:hypothetical protein
MTVIRLATAAVVLSISLPVSPHSKAQEASPSNATLQDTTLWIQAHLEGLSHTESATTVSMDLKHKPPREIHRNTNVHTVTVQSVKFDGCTLTVVDVDNWESFQDTTVSKIPLERMSLAEWKFTDNKPDVSSSANYSRTTSWTPEWYGSVAISGTENSILWSRRTVNASDASENSSSSGSVKMTSFASDDEELGKRLVRGLNHAIELCKASAKPEPF